MSTSAMAVATDDRTIREALRVVRALVPGFDPVECELLKRGKSDVFAVHAASGHPTLVAKCAREDTISIENRVLNWLEASPFPTLLTHGTLKASERGRAWLVSEYASGEPYSRGSSIHRRVGGAWLADLHVWSASTAPPALPSRDPAYHENVVREACSTLADALAAGGALTASDRAIVSVLKESGLIVLDHWGRLEALLGALPAALVHCGIAGKNVRVTADRVRPAMLAFDWEQAGWGCPAADMSMVDLDSYALRARQGGIELPHVRLVRAIGEVLWCFAGVPGERANLLGSWPHRAVGKLAAYLEQIRAAMVILDLERPS